jgi:glycosyltransferase involved in cell wall biosynthesis
MSTKKKLVGTKAGPNKGMVRSGKAPLFSVVVIGKNEEKTLPKLIRALAEFKRRRGDMVFVDTGSTDKTAEIAEKGGFTVNSVGNRFQFKLDKVKATVVNKAFVVEGEDPIVEVGQVFFNYSAARNYAMSLAKNDFIFSPDCDEEPTVFDIDKVGKLFSDGATLIWFDYVHSHYPDGKPEMRFNTNARCYNRKEHQFVGMIHETLTNVGKQVDAPRDVLRIDHWQQPSDARKKYLAGLAVACFNEPKNDRNMHYFGRELHYQKRYKSSIEVLTKHLQLGKWEPELAQSMIFIGDNYDFLGAPNTSLDWWHKAATIDGLRREPWMRLAKYFFGKGDAQHVLEYTSAALAIPPVSTFYMNTDDIYTFLPHHYMYWALWMLGKKSEAKGHWRKCLEYRPKDEMFVKAGPEFFDAVEDPVYTNDIPGWMLPQELVWLNEMAKKMADIIEIGSWKGRSTHALLSGCKGNVLAIDHFKGSPGEPQHDEAKTVDISSEFGKNVGHFNNLGLMKKSSLDAAAENPDLTADMIFIDGGHTAEDVTNDIKTWAPRAKKIICGHDYSEAWPEVRAAVNKCLGKVSVFGSIWFKEIKR